jgi:purine-binding chemotaxis protein CheW
MPDDRSYCTFRVDRLLLGVDVVEVQEVIRHREPTRVPTAPPSVRGLINLRGQIVTVLDLRERLGLAPCGPPSDPLMNVVVRVPGGAIGLVVDQVGDVLAFDETAPTEPPESIPEAVRCLVSGHYPLPDRSLLILDIARVVERGG